MGELVDFPSAAPTLPVLSDELEQATDELAVAIDGEAIAHNAYLRKYHLSLLAFRTAEKKIAATLMPKAAEGEAVDELCAWNLANARREACRSKAKSLADRLSALQTHVRLIEGQT